MAYNESLVDRVRERLSELPNIEEKRMMGGLVFMYNDKMSVGVTNDELMCRVDPDINEKLLERNGSRTMDFTNRPMIGYILINEDGMRSQKDFEFWVKQALDFNPKAKSSKKKRLII